MPDIQAVLDYYGVGQCQKITEVAPRLWHVWTDQGQFRVVASAFPTGPSRGVTVEPDPAAERLPKDHQVACGPGGVHLHGCYFVVYQTK